MLWFLGYNPVNPMKKIPVHWDYYTQVSFGCCLAAKSDFIYLKRNWRKSKGARKELRSFLYNHSINNVIWFIK